MQKLIHVEINPNINHFEVWEKLAANQESDRPFLTEVGVWMGSSHNTLVLI